MSNQNKRFMFTELQPGIRRRNLVTFYMAAFVTIGLAVLLSVLQPFLLEAFLEIPSEEQGSVTGTATVVGEIVLLCVIGAWGAASDKVGRRMVYVFGMILVALAYALLPLVSETVHLYMIRGIYAIGMAGATGMMATLAGDYVLDRDRGKANGFMGLCNAMGAAVAATVLAKVPVKLRESYIESGMEASEAAIAAGWRTYIMIGAMALFFAVLLRLGLAGRSTDTKVERIPFSKRMKEGIEAAKEDRVTAISYVTAFVARADLAIAGLFIPLWCSLYIQENPEALSSLGSYSEGGPEAAACMADSICLSLGGLERAGILIAMIGAGSLFSAPLMGILTDRINRLNAVAFALALNVVGYGLTYFVSDPFSTSMLFVVMIIGAGEVAGAISTQSLIQQQAPERSRGSVIGFFGFCGGLGILVNSFLGGKMFDAISYNAPFVWIAGLNLVVVFACIAVNRSVRREQEAKTDMEAHAAK